MKIGIHHRQDSFSSIWIEYCKNNNISYKLVNCCDSDIIQQLDDCDGLMWHWSHYDPEAILFARQLTYSIEQAGKKVFPNSHTCWHFDDKVGQKYMFEAINAPLISTFVFYDKIKALNWIETTNFPKVFKLRGGAGATNVRLVKNRLAGKRLVKKAFTNGFSPYNKLTNLKERIWHFNRDRNINSFVGIFKGLARLFMVTQYEYIIGKEKGYAYFQEFIPGVDSDYRIVIVGDKAFGVKRFVRTDDFRASGSGLKSYDPSKIDTRLIDLAFSISTKLNLQSGAYDFIIKDDKMFLIEISYGFMTTNFPGYWDRKLKWNSVEISPQIEMIKSFLSSLNGNQ
jgi:hypothetical protein